MPKPTPDEIIERRLAAEAARAGERPEETRIRMIALGLDESARTSQRQQRDAELAADLLLLVTSKQR